MRHLKRISLLLMILFCITGCEQRGKKEEVIEEVEIISDMNELEDGRYYILHDGKYYPLYKKGEATFNQDEASSSPLDSRSLFYMDDWEKIPTMYMGDSLIYYTSDNLNESVIFERFEDLGYSIGICNLSRMDSGRYALNATTGDDTKNRNINYKSDAARLLDLDSTQVIIDNIGGAQLRSGNISRGGTIIGLSKDKLYSTDLYVGTKLKNYVLKADTRILTSMEGYTINNYAFLRSKIIEIYIPEYFNTGYYKVGSDGVFRFVRGKAYTEMTDFNVPNNIPDEEKEEQDPEYVLDDTKDVVYTESFTVNQQTKVSVVFTYEEPENSPYELSTPVVKVIGNDGAYTLSDYDKGTLSAQMTLEPGQYKLEISGIHGRAYDYKVNKINTEEE